jgi:hypothetical protein
MRTILQEYHRSFFASLDPDQTELVWSKVIEVWPGDMRPFSSICPTCGEDLFEFCRDAGLDHARVVLALAREHEPLGVGAIETLVGQPIKPWAASVQAKAGVPTPVAPPPQVAPTDVRVVLSINITNPHREGTTAWAEFNRWEVGKTMGQLIQKGMSRRAARRGPRNGWITLGNKE